jgi:hypothetical protein
MREEVKAHNLRDRFGSRAYHLHITGSYEGQLKPDEFVTLGDSMITALRNLREWQFISNEIYLNTPKFKQIIKN